MRSTLSLRSFPNVAFETVAFEGPRLEALVYDILAPATAIIGYAVLQPQPYLVMPCSSHCHNWLCHDPATHNWACCAPATAILGYAVLVHDCHTWLCWAPATAILGYAELQPLPHLVMLSSSHCHTWLCWAPATATLGYTIGLIAAQMAVSSVTDSSHCIRCFLHISVYIAYTIANKTKIIWIEIKLSFFLLRMDTPHVDVCALTLCWFHSLISTQTFQMALTALVDRWAEIRSTPSVA